MGNASLATGIFAILLLAAAGLGGWFLAARAANARRRMTCMMDELGLDEETLATGSPQLDAVIREARKRCLRCRSEDLCERWLAKRVTGFSEDDFCPNAATFKALAGRGDEPAPGEARGEAG